MRVFKNCFDMIREIDRDLKVCGITVPVNHYQNKKLKGKNRITKELVGVSFTISKPLEGRKEMLEFMFKKDADRIEKYCHQEHKDRTCGSALNPGNSWKIRQDLWQKFMVDGEKKFDYTYSERMHWQLNTVLGALGDDIHSRQAIIQIFQADIDSKKFGGDTRIPCSVDYQIMIRNNRVHIIYHIRSNDYFAHFPIDIWLAAELMQWFQQKLKTKYPGLKTGSMIYFCGSLHAYHWDLEKWVIF